ncbi:MAG: glycosyl transferase [Rhodocyclaceae bacterium]|nr:glycosyl transferase [Rhodocyclaceae bacterium]
MFARKLAKGDPLYDRATLEQYVRDDLALIDEVKPDVIVADFRLSLAVSARIAKVRYANISNAYWSSYYPIDGDWPMPELPVSRILPLPLGTKIFNWIRPLAFRQHCRPLEEVLRAAGLPDCGQDLRRVYTDSDLTLYADVPSLFALSGAPSNHRVIGPIAWSPPVPLPGWWSELPDSQPLAYVTLGSSGKGELAGSVAKSLCEAGFSVVLATAGTANPPAMSGLYVEKYLPGDQAAARSDLVVCNGGSPTTQQALTAGKPVIGIANNLDQFLNMRALERGGVGKVLRADRFDPRVLASTARNLVENSVARAKAGEVAAEIARTDVTSVVYSLLRSEVFV